MKTTEMERAQQVLVAQVAVEMVKGLRGACEDFMATANPLTLDELDETVRQRAVKVIEISEQGVRDNLLAQFVIHRAKKILKVPLLVCALDPSKYDELLNDLETNIRKYEMGVEV